VLNVLHGAAVSKTAKARGIIRAGGLVGFGRMCQEAAGVATRIAFATLGHLVLLKIVKKFTTLSLFAAIVQPVAAHNSAMNCLECMLLLGVIGRHSLEFKFGQAFHLHKAILIVSAFWTESRNAVHIRDDRRNIYSRG
jgi:hypothetical protein